MMHTTDSFSLPRLKAVLLLLTTLALPMQAGGEPLPVDGIKVTTDEWIPFQRREAFIYAAEKEWQGVLIVSPGGKIKPWEMSVFNRAAAERGYLVVVVRYIQDVAAIPLPGNRTRAADFGWELKNRFNNLLNVPQLLKERGLDGLPFYAVGHSLGGAALGSFASDRDDVFNKQVLLATSSLIQTPSDIKVPTFMAVGQNDGLVDAEGLENLAELFQTEVLPISEVNHFCIVDGEAGDPDFRSRDLPSPLDQETCVARTLDTIEKLLQ